MQRAAEKTKQEKIPSALGSSLNRLVSQCLSLPVCRTEMIMICIYFPRGQTSLASLVSANKHLEDLAYCETWLVFVK